MTVAYTGFQLRRVHFPQFLATFLCITLQQSVLSAPVAKQALRYFPNTTECHSLGCFTHTRPVYKHIFAEFMEACRVGVAPPP